MKVHAIGAVRLTGEKNNRPYDFAQLSHLTVAEPSRTFQSGAAEAIGNEHSTLEIPIEHWSKFKTLNGKIPPGGSILIELTTEQDIRRGRIVNLVTGYTIPSGEYKDVK